MSKEEQKRRFLARLDEPEKNWKFSMADAKERGLWDDYMDAYEDMIQHTASDARALVRRARPTTSGSRGWSWPPRSSTRWRTWSCSIRRSTTHKREELRLVQTELEGEGGRDKKKDKDGRPNTEGRKEATCAEGGEEVTRAKEDRKARSAQGDACDGCRRCRCRCGGAFAAGVTEPPTFVAWGLWPTERPACEVGRRRARPSRVV